MKKIQTICGAIAPEELGFTSSHEHISSADIPLAVGDVTAEYKIPAEKLALKWENLAFLKSGAWILSKEARSNAGDYMDFIISELKQFKAVGGDSICEASVYGARGLEITDYKKISEKSGVNIVYATGAYTQDTWPEYLIGKSEDKLKAIFEKDIFEGIDGTDIKAGFLKTAFSATDAEGKLLNSEVLAFRACCRIAKETGMGLEVHLGSPLVGLKEAFDICNIALKQIGLPPDRLTLCHVDQLVVDVIPLSDYIRKGSPFCVDQHKKLLDMGVYLSFDGFGNFGASTSEFFNFYRPDDYLKVRGVHELLEAGYSKQLMLGHDFVGKLSGIKYGGYGYTRVKEFVIPVLRQLGHSEEEIDDMTVRNPREFLAF